MKKGVRITIILAIIVVVLGVGGYFAAPRLKALMEEGGFPGGPGRPGGLGGARGPRGQQEQAGEEEAFSVPVAVTQAKMQPMQETLILYGTVYPQNEVNIFATVTGKVKQLLVSEGEYVAKDQRLATIDRDQAGLKYAEAEVTSTVSGIVKSVMTQVGATVAPTAPLFQIVDMDNVEVILKVPEKKIAQVKRGQAAELSFVAYPGRTFYGNIYKLSPVVDAMSRTLEARILVRNPGYLLKPGMFAEARLVLRQVDEALVIPVAALLDREEGRVIYTIYDDAARRILPQVLFIEGQWAVVSDGLEAGDPVVVVGQQNLNDGDAVTIVEEQE
jgi:multidrug efflux pump subunit AcrA (membrane-fusion protein)